MCSDSSTLLSSNGINCVNACQEDEFDNSGVCTKCIDATSGKMAYCYSCNSAVLCTKCISSLLSLDSSTCTHECEATEFIDAAGEKCIASCPTTPERTYASVNKAAKVNFLNYYKYYKAMCI